MGRIRYNLIKILTADYCPLYIHLPPWSKPDVGEQLRLWASRYQWDRHRSFFKRLFLLALITTWPLRVLWIISHQLYEFAPKITARTGKSIWRQALEQLWLTLRHTLPPSVYYDYELYRPEQQSLIDHYVHQYEARSLLPYLNGYQHHSAIGDKAQFARLCTQQSLPTPPSLGMYKDGKCAWQMAVHENIFIKPTRGKCGEGAMMWLRQATDQYQDQQGSVLTWAALVTLLEQLSRQRAYLVQPCLRNHPTIAMISPSALSTARIVTGRRPDGAIEVIVATFKMAWQQQITNTYGLNSPIDLATGQLGRAYSYSPICPGYAAHPETGAQIAGCRLPDWQAAVALAQTVHQHFPNYIFLGWDIALTPQGPVVLEGNSGWDLETVQKPQRTPLAHTRFAEICGLWIAERDPRANSKIC